MSFSLPSHRLCARTLTVATLLVSTRTFFGIASAAENNAALRLRPHCNSTHQQECASYTVKDPMTLMTPELTSGSILDMDLVIDNPTGQPVSRVRGWMSYDPVLFEGKRIEPVEKFPIITPGEADFAPLQGFIQIGLSTANNATVTDTTIPVARMQLLVKQAPPAGKTVIAFYDVRTDTSGHTHVIVKEGAEEKNILTEILGSLLVSFKANNALASAASSASSAATSLSFATSSVESPAASSETAIASSATSETASSTSSMAGSSPEAGSGIFAPGTPDRTSFVLLQIQNVRVTTEGSTVYVAWDPLASSELQGYNVYYGTEMGRYLQRRTLPVESNTVALRALPLDTMYYLAVRAINTKNEESAFSQEVAVKVGDPGSSTAPLRGITDDSPKGQNPLEQNGAPASSVPGETGSPTMIIVFLLLSTVIGTLIAFRRQFVAVTSFHE